MRKQVDVSLILSNSHNPRIIKDDKFKSLVESLKGFPEMLEIRPIVVDESRSRRRNLSSRIMWGLENGTGMHWLMTGMRRN